MKKDRNLRDFLLFIIILGVCTTASCGFKENKQEPTNKDDAVFTMAKAQGNGWGADSAMKDNKLTVESMIKYSIQDEYLQRARYEYVERKYSEIESLEPLVKDENIHVYRMLLLSLKYKINIPQDRSNEFFFKFPKSIEDAYLLLVKSENDSIAMYSRFLEESNLPEEVKTEFIKQRDEAKKHLEVLREVNENN